MYKVFNKKYENKKEQVSKFIAVFETKGKLFGKADRNTIKLFDLDGTIINIKSFKIPNLINQITYKFFRKSKAQRSFIYANKLNHLKIGTPEPIAFYEFTTLFLFKKSFYVSKQLDCDYTYRDLTKDFNIPDYENILRAFTRFTYELHEKNILFLDHSPGNTLIKRLDNDYKFYLVDLNRMKFKKLSFEERIKNFNRLTTHKFMVEIMSDEYAKCSGFNYERVFKNMWNETVLFQRKFHNKRKLKKKIKFWKN
ncbi:lipopolysaccharide kinase InaA family protein [Mesoflavibacter sp. CH_XMU1422-2]|uniref:lipopolysaccharide kinase InaA family protein n=1 Tax=Mesoflavibacter sp. CH_XMU1422-2 TaxID=3107770 RepID=UPI00300A6831